MKKPRDDSAVKEMKVMKRKPEDVQTTAPESKKRKKQQIKDVVLPSRPKKAHLIVKKKKGLTEKNKNVLSKKSIKKSKGNKSQEEAPCILSNTEHAQDLKAQSVLKKNTLKNNSPQSTLKKIKKQSQQTVSQNKSSTTKSQGTANGLEEQKKKKKSFSGDRNIVEGDGILICTKEKLKKKKKKKKPQEEEQCTDKEASTTSASDSSQAEKKKIKNHFQLTLSSSTSENPSPPKSLQKQTKNKLHKRNENVVPVSKGPHIGNQVKEEAVLSQIKPELSKKKMKFMKFIKQKEDDVKGEDNKAGQTPQLKGKALKKHITNICETIAKLETFSNDQAILLLKVTSDGKKRKINERFQKIKAKLAGLESELAVYQVQVKGPTPQIVKNKVLRKLPEDPPPKKKERRLELKDFLQSQMKASRFRWLNENLYNSSSTEAQGFFKDDPESFKAYHEGYSEQVAKWPVNPLDVIIKELKSLPNDSIIADLGCGEAKLAAALPDLKVHSLDFIAIKPEVIPCDMAHCPLLRNSVDVVVFCLSLMGTNVSDFLLEANRILKTGGTMEIAEVESRFESIDDFIEKVQLYGFKLKKKNPMDMFFFLTFTKTQNTVKTKKMPDFELKPCVYKKR